jgi:ubiquinone biosynthesis protein COQ9
MGEQTQEIRDQLLDAALLNVVFDGWSETSFKAAVDDSGMDPALAMALFPRGALDLAIAYHKRGDEDMKARLATTDLSQMRFRERIALAVRYRLESAEDKEAVRRGATLFALPPHVAEGAKLVWGTADAIWTTLGDTSEDANWYSKRATLSGVYFATVLFWLGDDSADHHASWEFLDRRIDNVMQFETLKASAQKNPLLKPFLAGPNFLASLVRKPTSVNNLPGSWTQGGMGADPSVK